MIEVIRIITGFLEENCYIFHNGIDALIIDPGSDADKIIETIKSRNLNVKGILITHYHFDHVGALEEIKKVFNNSVIVDYKTKGDQTIGTFKFKIIETFGHTMDSVSYYFDQNDILFSGDFIFKETIGNFEEDEEETMARSLNIFKYMSNNVVIYPGHGESTTVSHEKEFNPFLRGI